MCSELSSLLMVGFVLVLPSMGCKSAPRHESDWAYDMASNMTYPAARPAPNRPRPAGDEEWVCPMHPSIRQSEPGTCSICGMDLVLADGPPDESRSASHSEHSHGSGSSHSGSSGCGHCGG
jgi:hypothetical protein